MDLNRLFTPFPDDAVHWRTGSTNKRAVQRKTGDSNAKATKGIPLAYIDARDAMRRLDEVCGAGNWQCRYPFAGCCEIGIRIDMPTVIGEAPNYEWVWKANGAGETDIEGKKGQYSDAFKRAAVLWGIGQYLYDLPNTWVDLDEWGKFKTAPKLPQWATPAGWARVPKSEKEAVYTQTIEALGNGDGYAIREIWLPYDTDTKIALWPMFNSRERSAIRELLKEAVDTQVAE